jgi:hypothetical protein
MCALVEPKWCQMPEPDLNSTAKPVAKASVIGDATTFFAGVSNSTTALSSEGSFPDRKVQPHATATPPR